MATENQENPFDFGAKGPPSSASSDSGGEDELFYAKVLASHVLDDICSSPIPSPCPTCSPQTQRGKRERTRSLSKSASKGQAAREPVLRTHQRTIYTAGRPPWYDTTGQLVEPFVIGICGGSASGKTTMAKTIIEALDVPWVTLLSMDSFYKVLNEEDHMLAHNNEYNFDHPDAFDFELMIETLSKLKEGRKVEVPIYNFVTHSREKRMKTMYGANVIIFEGILVFANQKLSELMDMKLFIDSDSDIRLARRLKRDITERGRDLEGVLKQYNKFVKPAFDYYIAPTMVHADLIVPRGGENQIAKNLVVQHIHSQLQQDVLIETPQLVSYKGKRIDTEKICGVSILRAGETMEQALCDVLKDVRLGKILIQTNPETVEPELYYLRLPKDIEDYKIILMDATVATGAAAMMAIRVLLDHDVREEDIFLCSLLMAESGVHTIAYAFPKVQIITSQVDPGVNDKFYIMPGIGNFGDRFFGTEAGL